MDAHDVAVLTQLVTAVNQPYQPYEIWKRKRDLLVEWVDRYAERRLEPAPAKVSHGE